MGIKRPLIILGSTVGAVASVLSYHPAASGSAAPLSNALEPVTDAASTTAAPSSTPTQSPAPAAPTPAPSTPTPTTAATPAETSKPAPSTGSSKTKKSSGSGTAANSTTNSSSAESSTSASAPAPTPESSASASAPAQSPSGKVAKDQTVTGATSQTRWGPVQVQITVKDGKIVDAVGLQYPNGDRRSQWISDQAIPWLVEETLTEQIANVQIIGGATYTSNGWRQSLASAMQKAGL